MALPEFGTVCGLDVAYQKDHAFAAATVLNLKFEVVAKHSVEVEHVGPYEPGNFAIREAQALMKVLEGLEVSPDVLLVDAHGIAHPRRFGLACLIGYIFDIATVGCAKNLLFGTHNTVGDSRGDIAQIVAGTEQIGAAVRTVDDVNPVFVSPGYRADVESSVDLVLAMSEEFRIPEPLREAHQHAESLRRDQRLVAR